jgi:hypothetical protein
MRLKKWLETMGWDQIDDGGPSIPHKTPPVLPGGPPPVPSGMIRLYRGTRFGELPHENAFFSDERGLEGIAKAFAKLPGRRLVYVDVPQEVARQGLVRVGVTDGEYKVPEEYRKQVRAL